MRDDAVRCDHPALRRRLDLADHLAVLAVPDEQHAVGAAGRDPRAVGRGGHAEDVVAGAAEDARDPAVVRVPDPHLRIARGTDHLRLAGNPAHRGHLLARGLERADLLAGFEVPDLEHVVRPAGDELLAVRLPVDGHDVVRVPFERAQQLAVGDARHLEELVGRGRGELRAVGAEPDPEDGVGMERLERAAEQPLADLPELDLARSRRLAAAGRQQLAVGAEVEGQDPEDVGAERLVLGPAPLEVQVLSVASAEAETRRPWAVNATFWIGWMAPPFGAVCPKAITPRPLAVSQTFRPPSAPAVARRSPRGENATLRDRSLVAGQRSEQLAVGSRDQPGGLVGRSGEDRLAVGADGQGQDRPGVAGSQSPARRPSRAFQIRTVPSSPPVTIAWPSGVTATPRTGPLWPVRTIGLVSEGLARSLAG